MNSLKYIPRGRIIGLYVILIYGTAMLFSKMTAPFYIPTNNPKGSNLSIATSTLIYVLGFLGYFLFCSCFFDSNHPTGCKMVCHCDFNLYFSD